MKEIERTVYCLRMPSVTRPPLWHGFVFTAIQNKSVYAVVNNANLGSRSNWPLISQMSIGD